MVDVLTESPLISAATLLFALCLLGAVAVLAREARSSGRGIGWLAALGALSLFVGERFLGDEDVLRMTLSGLGVALFVAAPILRLGAQGRSEGTLRDAHRAALNCGLLALAGVVLYGLSLETATSALGFEDEMLRRWTVVMQVLAPIAGLMGVLASLAIDRMITTHPRGLPRGATAGAMASGLGAALVLSLLFPVNYLASQHDTTWDLAYFRTAKAGESTLNIAASLPDPLTITLFFPPGNDVEQELIPYFDAVEAAGNGQITVSRVDQALDRDLAEQMKVNDNGQIMLTMGDRTERISVKEEMAKAKRDLRTLDDKVRKKLIKLTREERKVYWMGGHGEASSKEPTDVFRKIQVVQRVILGPANAKVMPLTVKGGSADAIPDDADLVVIAGPKTPLFEEEVTALHDYLDRGGNLLMAIEFDGDPMQPTLDKLGLESGPGVLARVPPLLRVFNSRLDLAMLATDKFGSHEMTKTLARRASSQPMIIPTGRWVSKKGDAKTKVSTVLRSLPDTWEDVDNEEGQKNLTLDDGETKKVYDLAVAVSGLSEDHPDQRILVVGDTNFMSDFLLNKSMGNVDFTQEAFLWLLGDEDLGGVVESEEDVPIAHTREQDKVWFGLTVLGVPFILLMIGVIGIRLRRTA